LGVTWLSCVTPNTQNIYFKEISTMGMTQSNRPARLRSVDAYLYIAPAFLLYAVFFLWPTIGLIRLTFLKWNGLGPKTFIGLANYARLLTDEYFWLAFRHNIYWLVGSVTVPIAFGLLLAILLSRSSLYGKVFFRTIYFLPQVLSSVSVAVIWGWIYNPNFGALNSLLGSLGLESLKQGWLASPTFALPALFIANSWVAYGFCMVIFIAAIDGIDEVYFDAAKVDGANGWQQFQHILLPFIRGPLSTIILVTAMGSFQVFDIVFVLTKGGPAYATLVIPMYMILNAFNYHNIGYGSAIAFVLGLLILLFSVIFLRIRRTFREQS
jgi:raffinose/stachyose/melibiose transport system permease protein